MPYKVRLLVIALAFAASACGGRVPPVVTASPPKAPVVDLGRLFERGCYRCLEDAFRTADDTGNRRSAFEAAVLLTLRAKELGIDETSHLARARELADAYPDAALYLEILEAAPSDPLSGRRYVVDDQLSTAERIAAIRRQPPMRERVAAWRSQLATAMASPLFRAYLAITASCTGNGDQTKEQVAATLADAGTPPILRYRAGLCEREREPDLKALRAEYDWFVDADYQLGAFAIADNDLEEGLRRYAAAHDAVPESLAIAVALGKLHDQREEWSLALPLYDEVVARNSVHRDAWLGRTIALSQLRRHQDGLAAATRLIELGAWFQGEAHYWRGWNYYMSNQLPSARVDVDRAKTLMVNAAVFVLSGLIEWGERRLPTADAEFQQALVMDFGRCDAARYLGRVRAEQGQNSEALAAFTQGVQCYDLSLTLRRKMIADVQAGPGSEAGKARLIASHERSIAELTAGRQECAVNADRLKTVGTR